eukprot:5188790-Prymnesium_polylepis.1
MRQPSATQTSHTCDIHNKRIGQSIFNQALRLVPRPSRTPPVSSAAAPPSHRVKLICFRLYVGARSGTFFACPPRYD